jgi:predicted nucleotide-binding protein
MSSNNRSTKQYVFQHDPRQTRLVNGGNVLLLCSLKEYEIDELNQWRNDGIVTIKWQFYGNGQIEKDSKFYLVNLTTFYNTNFTFPTINDIQWDEIIKQSRLNDNKITNLQDDKYSGNDRSKVLDELLNYTLKIRKSNDSEKYGVWQAKIERTVGKTYGDGSIELKQIKDAMKLNFVVSNGQTEEQKHRYFDNLYERRFIRIEKLINDFKSESEFSYESSNDSDLERSKNIFIVFGHDDYAALQMEKIIREFKLNPILLSDQANKGRTLIQKFQDEAKDIAYAFVLFTPDDNVTNQSKEYQQARPNVIFELGWFCGKIGLENVSIVCKKGTAIPSDLDGIMRIDYESKIEEQYKKIMKELKSSNLI